MKSSRLQKVLNHFSGLLLFVFTLVNALSAFAVPGKTTYQAKIVKPDGYPLEASNVNFKFTILDPVGSCILYSETYSSVNMSSTGGLISFALGSGVKTYPTSATTFEQVFSNITPSLSCDTGGPTDYSPAATDIRKIVMQFHDGAGWQTLPAMSINAVPYAMYANEATKLNGLTSSDFVQLSTVPTCAASEALRYTGASFSCVAVGNSVTSGTVVTALGYTPADGASVTTLTSNISSVSSTVFSVSSTVTSLQNSVAASFAAITSSQWTTSGTNIFYNTGNIGIGTTTPVTKLDVSGGVRIGAESTTCAPALAGTLRYNASNVEYCNGTSWQAFGVSGAGITNFNGSTSGTQTLATGPGGTAPAFNTSNGVHTLNIPLASTGSVTAGLISNADYTTFTNKITSSAASIAQVLGYVPADNAASGTYAQKANNLSDLSNVATARTNLGLGTFATASSIDLGSASATGTLAIARLPAFSGDATIAAASNTIILSNSGVTAGTYTKVTVDAKGRVTSSSALASSDVTTALGYTPANSATIVSSQWNTSGTTINYMNGHVGIGTTSPQEKLHVEGGSLLVTGDWGSGPTLTVSGAGTRMFFYPRKASFRGGYAYDDEWNENNIGEASFAFGDSVVASGAYSVAMGRNAKATAPYSTAFGQGEASGDYSTAFDSSTAYGLYSVAMGSSSAQGDRAIAMGGSSSANGESSVAIGRVVISNAYRNVAVGSYNIGNGSGTAWIATDPIFEIGNSQNGTPRTNAMTVLKNGNVGVTVSAPTARLHLASGTTSLAPLKFTSGTLLTSPQSGTMEYDGTNFYLTDSTNTRRAIAANTNPGTYDNVSNINSSSNITLTPTGSVVVSSTTASTNSSTGALIVNGGAGIAGNLNVAGTISGSAKVIATGFRANQGAPDNNDSSTNGYAFGTDGDTGMFSPGSGAANGVLAFYGNNAELVRITASGVGIGTSAPTQKLQVVGSALFGSVVSAPPQNTTLGIYGGAINTNGSFELAMAGGDAGSVARLVAYQSSVVLSSDGAYPIVIQTNGSEKMRVTASGNVGIGASAPTEKLEVNGNIKLSGNLITANGVANATMIYLKGTGLHNSANRIVQVGNSTLVNTGSRGLTLTLLNKTDYSMISSTNYDTYGSTAASDALAAALDAMDRSQIGLITSFDSWEGNVTTNLRNAFRRLGLMKAYYPTYRQPYAAIFEGAASATVYTAKSVEVTTSNEALSNYAELSGWLVGGTFAVTQSTHENVLYNPTGDTLGIAVNNVGNVGIGTTSPDKTLVVNSTNTTNFAAEIYNSSSATASNGLYVHSASTNPATMVAAIGSLGVMGDGNVGIGTTNPDKQLTMHSNGVDNYIHLTSSMTGTSSLDGVMIGTGSSGDAAFYNRESTNMLFLTSNTERVRITSSGAVGIGTTTPSAKLDVIGDIRFSTAAGNSQFISNVSNRDFDFQGNTPANRVLTVHPGANAGVSYSNVVVDFYGHNGAANIPGFTMLRSGNVGIGITNPTNKLEVVGGTTKLEQQPWQTPSYENSWASYGLGNYAPAGYYKDSLGIVHLRGLVAGGTIGACVFTLPAGYRPAYRGIYAVMTNPDAIGRADVNTDGCVFATAGNASWFSLEGITFRAEQ